MSINAPRQGSTAWTDGKPLQAGFTLVELMIIVALIGVFSMIAVPSFTQFIANNRTQSLNNEMFALLQFARSTAVERRTLVKVCPGQGIWSVKVDCTGSADVLRTLELPAGTSINANASELTFRYNGAGTEATLVTCKGNDAANGYTITVRSSGSTRTWSRGKNGPAAGDVMTTCTNQQPEG